jgi:hypothetical protein
MLRFRYRYEREKAFVSRQTAELVLRLSDLIQTLTMVLSYNSLFFEWNRSAGDTAGFLKNARESREVEPGTRFTVRDVPNLSGRRPQIVLEAF